MPNPGDDYALGRDLAAAMRLNVQHLLWKKYFGYNLHPAIPRTDANLAIADVGTGTGIWLLDMIDELPGTTQFHGFDVDISQAPHPGWLPPNVKLSELDVFKPVPPELEGKFDVVNLRLFMLVVKNNDPTDIVQNLVKMLKPGGWLQWSEADLINITYRTATPEASTKALRAIRAAVVPTDSRFTPGTWVPGLGDYLSRQGLVDVQCHKVSAEDMPAIWQAFTQEATLAVYPEIIAKLPPGEARDTLTALMPEAEAEGRNGASWSAPRLMWVGRKPL